jgi:uncharacterized protein YbcI
MTRINVLIKSLRKIASRDCSADFNGADHHTIMVAAARIELLQAENYRLRCKVQILLGESVEDTFLDGALAEQQEDNLT